jgi:fluoroacetyl-CoA thioesterase
MNATLVPGVERRTTYAVTEDMSPPHLPAAVLSTPAMIQMIEQTCLQAAAEHLDDGETTVGTHVCVSHTGPAAAGQEVTVWCRLREVERRRLRFDVAVEAAAGRIGEGTHERAVVDTSRFG